MLLFESFLRVLWSYEPRFDLGVWGKQDVFGTEFLRVLMFIIYIHVWDCQLAWVFFNLGRLGIEKPIFGHSGKQTAVCCSCDTTVCDFRTDRDVQFLADLGLLRAVCIFQGQTMV